MTAPMIEAEGLTKRYGDTQALAGIDLHVDQGTAPRRARAERRGQVHRGAHPHDAGAARRRESPVSAASTSSPRRPRCAGASG